MSELTGPGEGREVGAALRRYTPARVGLGRTGVSLETRELLDFGLAHARARDAVHARLDGGWLAKVVGEMCGVEVLRLRSEAGDRATYLKRPDLGRKLDAESCALLNGKRLSGDRVLALVIADGLSALGVERHAPGLLKELVARLSEWRLAPICIVEQGRVAIGDEIGQALGAAMVVVLIGERPGLSSPDSMGAYVTWGPRPGRTDAERNCISNIRGDIGGGGLGSEQAAAELAGTLLEASRRQLTGVALKTTPRMLEKG
jgi:ethanolamine ammonia-lyase small subunit